MFSLILLVSDRTKGRVMCQDIYDTLFLLITDGAEHFRKERSLLIHSFTVLVLDALCCCEYICTLLNPMHSGADNYFLCN